jgi:hypothetical protein
MNCHDEFCGHGCANCLVGSQILVVGLVIRVYVCAPLSWTRFRAESIPNQRRKLQCHRYTQNAFQQRKR